MRLRLEQTGDHEAVGVLQRAAFGGGEHGVTVARLVGSLRRDDPGALSLVAEEDGRVVGHVMVSRCLLDAPPRLVEVRSLSPLGIAPAWQRRGIGSALVRDALRRLDEAGVPLVFLEGDPRYYSRLGFGPAVDRDFRKPSLRIPDLAFQVVRLSAYEPWMTGTFVYSPTFWEHDCVGRREPAPE
jgi:putative acetyltransferase